VRYGTWDRDGRRTPSNLESWRPFSIVGAARGSLAGCLRTKLWGSRAFGCALGQSGLVDRASGRAMCGWVV